MKRRVIKWASALIAVVVLVSQAPAALGLSLDFTKKSSAVIVMFKPGKSTNINLPGVKKESSISIGSSNHYSLVKSDVYSARQLKSLLKKQSNIKYVEENSRVKLASDTADYREYQWALDNNEQQNGKKGEDVGVSKIHETGVTSGDKVVAVLDTGIDASHEDLKDHLWHNDFQRDLKGEYGYDFVNADSTPEDLDGHGTHCSGIITASQDGKGVDGINSNVKIMALKIIENEGGLFEILSAYSYIYRAQSLGVNVVAINNSWGADCESADCDMLKTAIDIVGAKGAISVFAAGNDAKSDYENGYNIPFDVYSDYMITVGATDEAGEVADYSNFGENVDMYAPGSNILSTVSYPSYLPNIYSEEKNKQVSAFYTDFTQNTAEVRTLTADGSSGKAELLLDKEDYFGKKSAGAAALKWSIKGAKAGDVYALCFPYTAPETSSISNPGYFSVMLKSSVPNVSLDSIQSFEDLEHFPLFSIAEQKLSDVNCKFDVNDPEIFVGNILSGNADAWEHQQQPIKKLIGRGSERAIVFKVQTGVDGDYVFKLDDLGMSRPVSNGGAAKTFGKYDFMSGTSQSAPYVTGAAALLDKYVKNHTVKKLMSYVIGSTRTVDSEKVSENGTLDFRFSDSPKPRISDCSSSGASITVKGDFFKAEKGRVYIGSKAVDPGKITWTDSQIKVDASDYANRTVDIKLETSGGDVLKDRIFVKGKVNNYKSLASVEDYNEYEKIASDGTNLYLMNETYGAFTKFTISGNAVKTEELTFPNVYSLFAGELAKDGAFFLPGEENALLSDEWNDESEEAAGVSFGSELVFYKGKLWAVAKYENGHMAYHKLVSYSVQSNKWSVEAQLPTDKEAMKFTDSSLGVYKGKLYLMGGYNAAGDEASTMVRVYDPSSKKWSVGAPLKSGRFKSLAFQVGGKLVLIYGGDGKNQIPKTAVFDGKTWVDKSAPPAENNGDENYLSGNEYYEHNSSLHDRYYKAGAGVAKNGLVIISGECEGMGDTFWYNYETDRFSPLPYSINSESSRTDKALGASVGGKFVCLTSETICCSLSYIPISSGCYSVTRKTKNCTISGNPRYLANDSVTISVKPSRKCYFKALYIDGKRVKGKSYTYVVTKDIKATAVCGAYVTKIKLSKKTAKVKAGRSLKLRARITPKKATNKKLKWKSSKRKYAVVNKKGLVRAKKAGRGKTVKIYARATDGSKKKAYCRIKII